MASLTPEQKGFLRSQKISLHNLFDVSGLRKSQYMALMDETGQRFTFGGVACKAGHTLRTKYGHCIQCDTAKIAFVLRPSATAYVYVAGSVERKLIKIGMTKDLTDRHAKLNNFAYGGASDWELLAYVHTKGAGRIEFDTQEKLKAFEEPGTYVHSGRQQACYELFRCPYSVAKAALREASPREALITVPGREDRILANYEF